MKIMKIVELGLALSVLASVAWSKIPDYQYYQLPPSLKEMERFSAHDLNKWDKAARLGHIVYVTYGSRNEDGSITSAYGFLGYVRKIINARVFMDVVAIYDESGRLVEASGDGGFIRDKSFRLSEVLGSAVGRSSSDRVDRRAFQRNHVTCFEILQVGK